MFSTPMNNTFRRPQKGFTLIELLTVIAIIGILAAIIIPTVGKVQETAKRAADSSNLRQVGQASLIFAQSSRDQLPSNSISTVTTTYGDNVAAGGTAATVKIVAAALAKNGGLESGQLWISKADKTTTLENQNSYVGNILNPTKTGIDAAFNLSNLAFGYVVGLSTNYSSTTPVAFTRGIAGTTATTGKWDKNYGAYNDDGGHIVFIGGNVAFYKNLGTTTAGELINGKTGASTNNIRFTIDAAKANVKFIEEDAAGASTATDAAGV